MTAGRSIDYDAMTQDALRGVVRAVLVQVGKTGLPGEHHFYIAFDTQAPGVVLSRRLKEKYPEEMMIVLQHRFWDLAVGDDGFEVKLTFDGIPERLVIPFNSIRVFFDPSVRFTLQFGEAANAEDPAQSGPRRKKDANDGDAASPARLGARAAADRRPKPRARQRDDRANEGGDATKGPVPSESGQPTAPAVFTPRVVEPASKPGLVAVSAPKVDGQEAGAAASASPDEQSESAPAAAPAGAPAGAKVFSLDQFRKK